MALARHAHVYRVYATDGDGLVTDPDVWIDVMRINRCVFDEPRGVVDGESHNDRAYILLWGDDTVKGGDTQALPAPSRRKYERLKVTEPPEHGGDPHDPNLKSVVIPLIQRTWLTYRGSGQGLTHQEVEWVFRNFADQSNRRSTVLRITNNDLNEEIAFADVAVGDPQPPTNLDDNPPVAWDDYIKAMQDGLVDEDQFVDVAVTDRFHIRFPPSPTDQTGALVSLLGQEVTYVMLNRQQGAGDTLGPEDWFSSPPGTGTDSGPNTPGGIYRTDPFQIIVNVSWNALAVEFGDKAADAPDPG